MLAISEGNHRTQSTDDSAAPYASAAHTWCGNTGPRESDGLRVLQPRNPGDSLFCEGCAHTPQNHWSRARPHHWRDCPRIKVAAQARAMLDDTNWFTEGFDTADLKEAKAL